MSLLASWLASPPPDAAVDISAQRVSAASMLTRGRTSTIHRHAVEALPPGAVAPSLTGSNIADPTVVGAALRRVFAELGAIPRRVALVVPDVVARVSLIKFDQVPARKEDLDELVRWQVRKSAPFSIDDASVTYTPGLRGPDGAEFLVVLARRDVVSQYERVCELAGAQPGLVDLATLSVVNLFLGTPGVPGGDWLLVHMRPDYTSLVIMRGGSVALFRSRPDTDGEAIPDLVHQTAMYYQDRLAGGGFERVMLGGRGQAPGAVERARRSLDARLGMVVDVIDPTRAASLADRIHATDDDRDMLAPLVGMLLRTREGAEAA